MNYAITVTLKPNRRLDHNQKDDLARDELQSWIEKHKKAFKWSLVTELTRSGVPHYHGVLRVMSVLPTSYPIRWLNLYLNRQFNSTKILGFVMVKSLDDWPTWRDYCLKEIHQTKDLMASFPIVIDECDFLPSHFEVYADQG